MNLNPHFDPSQKQFRAGFGWQKSKDIKVLGIENTQPTKNLLQISTVCSMDLGQFQTIAV